MSLLERAARQGRRSLPVALAGVGVAWAALYWVNEHLWDTLLGSWLGLDLSTRLWGSVHFFAYDAVKILLLLVGMIFAIGMLRTTLRPERVRSFLEGKPTGVALLLAALLGAVTPFCSCSSIPLFIGLVSAGVPLGVTLTFLVASPLVNEVAVVLLAGTFGPALTVTYVGSALTLAVAVGWLFTRLRPERWVEEFVFTIPTAALHREGNRPSLRARVDAAAAETRDIVGRVWVWVLVGVGAGAVIHGWVPAELIAAYAGPDNPLAVPLATLLGVPLYANAAGVIPIAEALWAKGMATGTVMAFMMGTVALSLPEAILLRRVLKPPLLALFFAAVTAAIVAVGLLLNALF